MDRLSDYDYELPSELIASSPATNRDDARLLVVDRETGFIEHRRIRDLPEFVAPRDALVLNDTKVLPARLFGTRTATGGRWEGLFLNLAPDRTWRLMSQTKGKLVEGETIAIRPAHDPLSVTYCLLRLVEREPDGIWRAHPESTRSHLEVLEQFGTIPLPPYIKKSLPDDEDWKRYQTTFARHPGSVAAPTAGLHFTPELIKAIRDKPAFVEWVTLHVGIGTFRPISVEKLDEHVMHSEWCEITAETASRLNEARRDGGRLLAVGTTSVRTLESASESGEIESFAGGTSLFIRPPYEFRAVDRLLTNFHLPKSSLLVMVSAFAGSELIREVYRTAIDHRYRFFSYGDAMLIL